MIRSPNQVSMVRFDEKLRPDEYGDFASNVTLVGGLEHFHFSIQLGISSSQLTFTPSFFRGVGQPPTRLL